jgi:hypothetical protein
MTNTKFSTELESWLESSGKKTVGDLLGAFEEKSFAILFLLLMSPSALPIPTGGVTHVFEIAAMLLALELIVGRRTPWLPKRVLKHELGATTQKKAIPFLVRRVRWFEKYSRRRGAGLLENRLTLSVLGVGVLGFTLGAFFAPPFSGLDTVPSLGIVIVSLGLILEDALMVLVGLVVGLVGAGLVIALGSAAAHLIF